MGEARPRSEVGCPAAAFAREQPACLIYSPSSNIFWRWLGVGRKRRDWLGWESSKKTGFGGKVDLGMDGDIALRAQGMGLTRNGDGDTGTKRSAPAQTKPEF